MTTRVALVTGASQGIGYAIAVRLAQDGLNVAVNDIVAKSDKLDSVVSEIRALGRQSISVPADVSSDVEVKQMVDRVVFELGSLDVMIANAGVALRKSFIETTTEDLNFMLRVNSVGVFNCYKFAAIQMIAQGRGGRIIGASSNCGLKGFPSTSVYSMSKFAVRALTQSVAQELRPHNILVNTYAPGLVSTDMTGGNTPDGMALTKAACGMAPDTPHTEPAKIASVVSFLAGPDSSFISGQTVPIEGGALVFV